MKLIDSNLETISALCRKFKVKTLAAFGSVLTDRFSPESDVDFLVNFQPYDYDSLDFDYVSNYFELKESLENLLGRKVDLVEDGNHLNPYFRYCVNKKKRLIYG